ncbi:MAG: hypothetical protein HN354_05405 [Deltaproteobacteria bacterium]|nr:hypothetical protein [Deltaproteobacteria bacterium]
MKLQNPEDLLRVNRVFLCNKKGQNVSFMACPLCEYYSCSQLTSDQIKELNVSPLMDRRIVKLIPRRCKLFIIKYLDGTLKEAPELDPNNPDRHLMQDVDTVYQIGKELVPVIVLKPKPKQDRDRIIKEAAENKAKKN